MYEWWYCDEGSSMEIFDSEETARMAYTIWCKQNHAVFNEKIFRSCYKPLNEFSTVWTKETLKYYTPS